VSTKEALIFDFSAKAKKSFRQDLSLILEIAFRSFVLNGLIPYILIFLGDITVLLILYPGKYDFGFELEIEEEDTTKKWYTDWFL
jgi:hypothetical protein